MELLNFPFSPSLKSPANRLCFATDAAVKSLLGLIYYYLLLIYFKLTNLQIITYENMQYKIAK